MVYSADLKSAAERHAGSSPATRTIYKHTTGWTVSREQLFGLVDWF